MPFVPAWQFFRHNSPHYPCSQTGEMSLGDHFWGCYSLMFLLESWVRGQSTSMTNSRWHSGRCQFLQAGMVLTQCPMPLVTAWSKPQTGHSYGCPAGPAGCCCWPCRGAGCWRQCAVGKPTQRESKKVMGLFP